MSSLDEGMQKVTGVVTQFNTEWVIFEFDQDKIGCVATSHVLPDGQHRSSIEAMAKFLNVGDRVECNVVENNGLEPFTYTVEEEEIVECGDVTVSTSEISIQPEWIAEEVKLLKASNGSSSNGNNDHGQLGTDEIGEIEGQLDDIFDDQDAQKKAAPKAVDVKVNLKEETKKEPAVAVKAKVLHLRKPKDVRKGRTQSGVMEVLNGEHEGQRAVFMASNLLIWGHNCTNANLMYHIKPEDIFEVELSKSDQGSVIVRKAWLGDKNATKRESPTSCVAFSTWLNSKSIQYDNFNKWVNNLLPFRPYFPLATKAHRAEVVSILKQKNYRGTGLMVRLLDWPDTDKTVIVEKEDLYLHGVSVGASDLRILIRKNDTVSVQLEPISLTQKKKLRADHLGSKDQDCNLDYAVSLGWIGSRMPKTSTMQPIESMELKEYLEESLDMTLNEFIALRKDEGNQKTGEDTVEDQAEFKTKDQIRALQAAQEQEMYTPIGLVTRAMQLSGPDDPKAKHLLNHPKDAHSASILVKILSRALLYEMQTNYKNLRHFLQQEHGSHANSMFEGHFGVANNFISTANTILQEHAQQQAGGVPLATQAVAGMVSAAVSGMGRPMMPGMAAPQGMNVPPPVVITPIEAAIQRHAAPSMLPTPEEHLEQKRQNAKVKAAEFQDMLKQSEEALKRETEDKIKQKSAAAAKSVSGAKKMRSMLESFKASKKDSKSKEKTPTPAKSKDKDEEDLTVVYASVSNDKRKTRSRSRSNDRSSRRRRSRSREQRRRSRSRSRERRIRRRSRSRSPRSPYDGLDRAVDRELEKVKAQQNLHMEKSMSPLQLVRLYTCKKKTMIFRDNYIHFGAIKFHKNVRTNFMISGSNDDPVFGSSQQGYYTLQAVYHFVLNADKPHEVYQRDSLLMDGVPVVRMQDRNNMLDYIFGRVSYVSNLAARTHSELNPDPMNPGVRPQSPFDSRRSTRFEPQKSPPPSEKFNLPVPRACTGEDKDEYGGSSRSMFGRPQPRFESEYGSSSLRMDSDYGPRGSSAPREYNNGRNNSNSRSKSKEPPMAARSSYSSEPASSSNNGRFDPYSRGQESFAPSSRSDFMDRDRPLEQAAGSSDFAPRSSKSASRDDNEYGGGSRPMAKDSEYGSGDFANRDKAPRYDSRERSQPMDAIMGGFTNRVQRSGSFEPQRPSGGYGNRESEPEKPSGYGERDEPFRPSGYGSREELFRPSAAGYGNNRDGPNKQSEYGNRDEPMRITAGHGNRDKPVEPVGGGYGSRDEPGRPSAGYGNRDEPGRPSVGYGNRDEPSKQSGYGNRDEPGRSSAGYGNRVEPGRPSVGYGNRDEPGRPSVGYGNRDEPMKPTAGYGALDAPVGYENRDDPARLAAKFGVRTDISRRLQEDRDEPFRPVRYGNLDEPAYGTRGSDNFGPNRGGMPKPIASQDNRGAQGASFRDDWSRSPQREDFRSSARPQWEAGGRNDSAMDEDFGPRSASSSSRLADQSYPMPRSSRVDAYDPLQPTDSSPPRRIPQDMPGNLPRPMPSGGYGQQQQNPWMARSDVRDVRGGGDQWEMPSRGNNPSKDITDGLMGGSFGPRARR